MQIANSMPELVKDNTAFVVGDSGGGVDPTIVHGRIGLRNLQGGIPNVGPRTIVRLEGNTNFGVIPIGNEAELEVSLPLPLLNDFLDFGLLDRRADNWGDEPDGDGLERSSDETYELAEWRRGHSPCHYPTSRQPW